MHLFSGQGESPYRRYAAMLRARERLPLEGSSRSGENVPLHGLAAVAASPETLMDLQPPKRLGFSSLISGLLTRRLARPWLHLSQNLRRDMADVFALAGGMAATIFERAKEAIFLDAGEFGGPRISVPPFPAPIACSNPAPARSRSADMPLSCLKDELLGQFDLFSFVSPGPPRTLAYPLLRTAPAPVYPDRF